MSSRLSRRLGLGALVLYALHAAELLLRFPPQNLLWSCNLGALLVAAGLLGRAPRATAVGALLLVLGEPIWMIDLLGGGELLPTAPLTHVGSLVLGLVGTRRLGLPAGTWWRAVLVIAIATAGARLAGPASENINLAFALPRGWEWFPSHGAYLAALGAVLAVCAAAPELVLVRLGFRRPAIARADGVFEPPSARPA